MKLQMKNGYLAVKELPKDKQTETGIFLPDNVGDEFQTSICEIVFTSLDEYKVGQHVMFSKLVPDDVEMEIDGEKQIYWFVHESDIKAVIK